MHQERLANFSLHEYYKGTRVARLLDLVLVILLTFFIIYTPLPFGSVQIHSITIIEIFSVICLMVWISKLTLCGREDMLSHFRHLYEAERQIYEKQPFFGRHFWLARVFRILTFGNWPKKYKASNLLEGSDEEAASFRRMPYYSAFGYPVKNTGLEILGLLLLLVLVLQIVPLPAFFVRVISPATADLYQTAATAAGKPIYFHPISINPFATFSKLLLYMSYYLIFLSVVNNIRTRGLFAAVLYAIFVSAVFQGIYGLYEFLSGNQHIFHYVKKYGLDSASGTFINRNHYAAYLELSIPLLISLVAGRISQLKAFRGNLFVRMAHALETEGSQILLILLLIVLVSVGLIFSMSRSGISFALVSLIAFLFLYRRARHKLSTRTYLLLGVGMTAAFAVWIGLNPLLERFVNVTENWEEGSRWGVWKDTFVIFLHFPVVGTGGGTFADIYPMYRSFVADIVYLYAHNDYLQFLAEIGIVSIILFIAFFDLLIERLIRILHRDLNRLSIIQIAAFCSLVCLGLHSLTDFSFQIPAIAVLGAIITGIFFSHYHTERRVAHA